VADAIVVGAGLAGLVATAELAAAGRRVILLDQEPEQSFGGQAWWSFGGLFLVDSPEQRRLRIRDSHELAWQDWLRTAGFDRPEDAWPRRWAEAYVEFAAGEKRAWLHERGLRFLPNVGWAERGWNSVPRFHVTWGTGPGVVEPFARAVRESGSVEVRFRHRVDALSVSAGAVDGVSGTVLAPDECERGRSSLRDAVGTFELRAPVVVLCSGGLGGNHDLVRRAWPERLGAPPQRMLSGVPAHVDGRGIELAQAAGAAVINPDRMWHYVEGIENRAPVWPLHGIRILPGPSSLWLDATGRRLPAPLFPGFDTLGTLAHVRRTGHDHTWFVLTQKIVEKEFALSGSEQNPDITSKSLRAVLKTRVGKGAPAPVAAFLREGADFVVADDLRTLVDRMNALTDEPLLDLAQVEHEVAARDRADDEQAVAIRNARTYFADKVTRIAAPHSLLDPAAGPLIAVRLHVLTRKTLGGLQTDLSARALGADGAPIPGLFAAGEAAGFGGGGMHGYRSLEGTFLGGCIFSGRVAGRAAAG
jgi:predicted oxidoreductase